jgi:hypothetical protein
MMLKNKCAIPVKELQSKSKKPRRMAGAFWFFQDLTMTYFRMGNPYYHRRNTVSRPCSGWEGVGPARYARQEFFCSAAAWGLALWAVTDAFWVK